MNSQPLISKDPYFQVKEEVLQSVQGVNAVFERWKHLLENTNTVGNKDFEWNSEEIKRIISETEEDLDMLQRSVDAVESHKDKRFNVSSQEIAERRKFIQEIRSNFQRIKEEMNSSRTKAKIEQDKRQALISTKRKSDRLSRLEEVIEKDNQDFIDNQQQIQMQLIQHQDKHLDEIKEGVGTLKEMGWAIDSSIKRQDVIIEEIDKKVDTADSRLKRSVRKVEELLNKTNDSTQMCVIVFLILALIGLLVAVFYI